MGHFFIFLAWSLDFTKKIHFCLIYTTIFSFRGATGRYRRISSSSENPQLKRTNIQQEKQGRLIHSGSKRENANSEL